MAGQNSLEHVHVHVHVYVYVCYAQFYCSVRSFVGSRYFLQCKQTSNGKWDTSTPYMGNNRDGDIWTCTNMFLKTCKYVYVYMYLYIYVYHIKSYRIHYHSYRFRFRFSGAFRGTSTFLHQLSRNHHHHHPSNLGTTSNTFHYSLAIWLKKNVTKSMSRISHFEFRVSDFTR